MHMTKRILLTIPLLLAACSHAATPTSSADDVAADVVDLADALTPIDAIVDTAGDATVADVQALCLEATPNPVLFTGTKVGAGAVVNVKLANCGLNGVCLTDLELQLGSAYVGEYMLDLSGFKALCPSMDPKKGPSANAPCCLAPAVVAGFDVYFTPTSANQHKTAQVWIKWNGPQITLGIDGTATAN